jgi:hypothetical protein
MKAFAGNKNGGQRDLRKERKVSVAPKRLATGHMGNRSNQPLEIRLPADLGQQQRVWSAKIQDVRQARRNDKGTGDGPQ